MAASKSNTANKLNSRLYSNKKLYKNLYNIGSGFEEVKKELSRLDKKL